MAQEKFSLSNLTKEQRKKIGRKVLNATIKNSPPDTMIDTYGTLFFFDDSIAKRTGHGRGKKSRHKFTNA